MTSLSGRVAVIGAGMAGLTVTRLLSARGWDVTAFEKARGPGGRMSTRRRSEGQFDHGAQYFTVRTPEFAAQVMAWADLGVVAPWQARQARWGSNGFVEVCSDETWWVGVPRMSALTRHLSEGLAIQSATRVVALERASGVWTLTSESGELFGPYDWVVLTCPGPQAVALTPSESVVHSRASDLSYRPCWAAMIDCQEQSVPAVDAIRMDHPILEWGALDSSKPGRPQGNRWVFHAQPSWSAEHADQSPEWVSSKMAQAIERVLGCSVGPVSVHRWLYARAELISGPRICVDDALGLGLCGDGLSGPRVEDAWLSAKAMIDAIASMGSP